MITETASDHRRGLEIVPETETARSHEAKFLHLLDEFLEEQVERFEPEVSEFIVACLGAGGKRIRPTLLSRAAFSTEVVFPDIVKAAAVVELVHLATLVHDDVLDEAMLRRGNVTLFSDQGASVAVLVGDALFSHALKLASEFPTNEVCSWVSEATRRTCAGEIRQTFHRGKLDLSLEQYYRIIELKTAEFFRVSCLLSAFLGGFDESYCKDATGFGLRLGVAYQLYDDLADIFGDELCLGKTLGTDWANRKPTLPLILLLRDMDSSAAEQLWSSQETSVRQIKRMILQRDVFGTCVKRVRNELVAAEKVLAPFANLSPVPHLLEAVQYMESKLTELDD